MERLFVAGFAGILTLTAMVVSPTWDDGWFVLFEDEDGKIFEVMRDRPLVGMCWNWLHQHSLLWPAAHLVHWLVWCGIGLLSAAMWRRLFPGYERYTVLVACTAMAPLLCTTQLVLLTNTFTGQISPVLTYLAFVVVARRRGDRTSSSAQKIALIASTVALLLAASLISEYTVPAGLACGMLLLCSNASRVRTSTRLRTAFLFVTTVCVGYVMFWMVARADARLDVRPEATLADTDLGYRARVVVFRLVNETWRGSIGYLLESVGELEIHPSYIGVALVIPAAVMALLCWPMASPHGDGESPVDRRRGSGFENVPALIFALMAGLAPILFMRNLSSESRFWLPLLPITSCLSIRLSLGLVTEKLRWLIGPTIGFVSMYATTTMVYEAISDHRRVEQWGNVLEQHVSDEGLTLAVLTFDEISSIRSKMQYVTPSKGADYWLTAVLTSNWDTKKAAGFWAISNAHHEFHGSLKQSVTGIGRSLKITTPSIRRNVRGLTRKGPIARVLWVRILRDRDIRVELVESFP